MLPTTSTALRQSQPIGCFRPTSISSKHRTSTGGSQGGVKVVQQCAVSSKHHPLEHSTEGSSSQGGWGTALASSSLAAALLMQPGPVFGATQLDAAPVEQQQQQEAQAFSSILASAGAANLSAPEAPALVGNSGDVLLEGVKGIVETGLQDLAANSMTAVGGPVTSDVLSASANQAAADSPTGDVAAGLLTPLQQQQQSSSNSSSSNSSRSVWCSAWQAYCDALERSPLPTKMYTGVVGTLLGDLAAQVLSHTSKKQQQQQQGGKRLSNSSGQGTSFQFDAVRAGRLCLYSALIGTPMGHYEYAVLESSVLPDTPLAPAAVAAKVALDQLVQTPFGMALFLAVMKMLEGKPQEVKHELQTKMLPALSANYKLWPLAQLINFTLIPEQQRILYGNVVGICWTCIISNMQHAHSEDEAASSATSTTTTSDAAVVPAVVVGDAIRPPPQQLPLDGEFALRRRSSSAAIA